MSILPIRGLGAVGIITDTDPYNLPTNAISMGNNIRFDNGKVKRANVFKTVLLPTATTPAFTFAHVASGSQEKLGIVNITGETYFFTNSVQTDVTPAAWVQISSGEPFTYCMLANVGYLNRNTSIPTYFGPLSTNFVNLPAWPVTYTCRALRAYKNFLVALNITKAGVANKTMVKWSDLALANSVPISWDETDQTKSAGENTLAEMPSQILDGLALRDAFVIYSKTQTHLMEYTADQQIFRFRKIFDNAGIINTNCCVEVLGGHYVFGPEDIYQHDGIGLQSIISNKNKDYVFNNLNNAQTDKCFVLHLPKQTEILFCYISNDAQTNFMGTPYCNKAAVFNYANATWSFRDLPNTSSGALTAISYALNTYAATTLTYATVTDSYYSILDNSSRNLYFASPKNVAVGLSATRIYGYDAAYQGNLIQSINTESTKPAWAMRSGIDLDETGEQLRAYKVVRAIYPQANALGGTGNFTFSFGATEFVDQVPVMGPEQAFTPPNQEKVDVTQVGGRYLSWRVTDNSNYSFELSGFDVDVVVTGRR